MLSRLWPSYARRDGGSLSTVAVRQPTFAPTWLRTACPSTRSTLTPRARRKDQNHRLQYIGTIALFAILGMHWPTSKKYVISGHGMGGGNPITRAQKDDS